MDFKKLLSKICVIIFITHFQLSFSQSPTWAWAKNSNNGISYGLAKDNIGNVFVTGYFYSDTMKIGSINLLNTNPFGGDDIFLTKFDVNGNVIWSKGAKGGGNDYSYSVATDATGNSYITGSFTSDTLSLGSFTVSNTNPGQRDVYVAKYDPNGNPLWIKAGGGAGTDEAYSIATDALGNCYITGYFGSTSIVLGTYTLTQTGMKDMFLAKYDSNGNIQWAKNPNGNDQDWGRSVTVDPSGNIWTSGSFQSQFLSIGTTTLTNAGWGFSDIFVLKFDANGNSLLGKRYGNSGHEETYSISSDPSGNIFIGGWFKSPSFSFGTTTLTVQGLSDWFLAKLDLNGDPLWAKSAGGTQDDVINSISADAAGNVYTTGAFRNTIAFTTSTLVSLGFQDVFVAKYNSSGAEQFAMRAGATYFDGGTAIMAIGNDCVVTGSFQDSIKFGLQPTLLGNAFFIARSGSVTGIKGFDPIKNISVYPNPSGGKFFIQSETKIKTEVYNSLGGKVLNEIISNEIDLSKLPKGIYFAVCTDEKGNKSVLKLITE